MVDVANVAINDKKIAEFPRFERFLDKTLIPLVHLLLFAASAAFITFAIGTVALHVLLVDAIVEVERERTAVPGASAVLPEAVAPRLAAPAA